MVLGERSPERRQAARLRLGLSEDAPVLLNVGRQDNQKAQTDLVHAFSKVREHRADAVLLIAGREGDASERLHDAIVDRGLTESVRLLGHRDDVADLYVASDLFVFPSLYEGLGSAIIEAMALGTPVIGSDAPAIAEVLGHGSAGVVVPRGRPAALASTIIELLDDAHARLRIGRSGRQRFESNYELTAVADATEQLYRRLVQDR